jgi:CBS domain-containing protein
MQLKEIMTKTVETIDPRESLQAAADKMDKHDTGFLPVVEDDMPMGVVTDRDIVIRGVAMALDPKNTQVREVMTMNMESLPENADVDEAVRLMEEKQIRRLVVRGKDDRITGVVSLGDVALETGNQRQSGEALEKVSETR